MKTKIVLEMFQTDAHGGNGYSHERHLRTFISLGHKGLELTWSRNSKDKNVQEANSQDT